MGLSSGVIVINRGKLESEFQPPRLSDSKDSRFRKTYQPNFFKKKIAQAFTQPDSAAVTIENLTIIQTGGGDSKCSYQAGRRPNRHIIMQSQAPRAACCKPDRCEHNPSRARVVMLPLSDDIGRRTYQ